MYIYKCIVYISMYLYIHRYINIHTYICVCLYVCIYDKLGKLAERLGDNKQRGHNKRILPGSKGEITHKNKLNIKLYNHVYGPREQEQT